VQTKKKLALAMSAMSIAALGGGIGAASAHAQNEVLTGTATTIWGGANGLCFGNQPAAATVAFNAAGSAAPYAGTFTEANASASLTRIAAVKPYTQLKLAIPFTIVSGSTTISGAIANPSPYAGGYYSCFGGSFHIGGVLVNANGATYTATIQRSGQPAQTVSGTAEITGGFEFQPYGVSHSTTVKETLLNLPSP
jgi:hypothetical protein